MAALTSAASGAATGAGFGPWGAGIGAGLGLLSSLFGGNKPQQQITSGDPGLQGYINQYRTLAGNAQQDPAFLAAMHMLMGAGGQDPNAAMGAMNPFMQQMNPFFEMLRRQAVTGANQEATKLGAFGGTGSQIGADVAGNLADQNQAGFTYQAFNDAMQRMLQSASGLMSLPGARLGLLTPGFQSASSTTTIPQQNNPFLALLGGGLAGAGAGGSFGKGF